MTRVTTVPGGQSPRRLDIFVSTQHARLSRTRARRWIDGGLITINGQRVRPARRVRPGDVIACHVAVPPPPSLEPEPVPLEVLHEDAALLVVNKPAGLVMHPAPGHWSGTLLNALVHHLRPCEDAGRRGPGNDRRARPGLVHRLDKGTSGVLVVAKTDAAHRDLARQFRAHTVHRVYLALVAGVVRRGGLIDRPLGPDPRQGCPRGRPPAPRRAVTEFRVAERLGPGATLLEVRPRTGRTHQIRIHLASIGHAVLGDRSHGGFPVDADLDRPMLHAAALGFIHPATGEHAEYRAPLPPDMERAVRGRRARSIPGEPGGAPEGVEGE